MSGRLRPENKENSFPIHILIWRPDVIIWASSQDNQLLVCHMIRFSPACSATETSENIETLHIAS